MKVRVFIVSAFFSLAWFGLINAARGQRAPTLDVPVISPAGEIALVLHGDAGENYAIEVSRNLNSWLPLASAIATNGEMDLQYSPGANAPALFFRGRLNAMLPPLTVTVQTDTNDQTLTLITPDEGGSLSLTDTHGIVYTLTVPPQAVFDSQIVTMTVVTNLDGLPFASGLLGAVAFAPDGFRLAQAAQFVVQLPSNPPIDTRKVVGYAFDGDGRYLRLVPAVPATNSLLLPITSLSGLGCSVATLPKIQQQGQHLVADTNSIASGGLALQGLVALQGAYYDSCYPAEKTRAVFVNKGLENAVRTADQAMAEKMAANNQLADSEKLSSGQLDLGGNLDSFYKDDLQPYAEETQTNCALAEVITRYTSGVGRQTALLGLDTQVPSTLLAMCDIFPGCARKIGECCKTKGAGEEAVVELLGFDRQAALLGCDLGDLWQYVQDCLPLWYGTVKYQDTYTDTLRTSAVVTRAGATLQLVWSLTNAPPAPFPQNGLLLFPDAATLSSLAAVDALITETDASSFKDQDGNCVQTVVVKTSHDTDPYSLANVFYNSADIKGTVNDITGSYRTNWTATDGTKYTRQVSWDLHRKTTFP